MIAIIDYDAGNIRSVEHALDYLKQDYVLTRDKDVLLNADKVILPGVGAFGDAMEKLRKYDLEEVIHRIVAKNTPFIGICLGLQLLFEESEEANGVKGLGLLKGKILKIPDENQKVPQIGWNCLHLDNPSPLFKGIGEGSYVYFVHSYYLKAANADEVIASTNYGVNIHAAVQKNNIFGCQFHPEKSSTVGLQLLKNFIEL